MELSSLLQGVINGLLLGGVYALASVGANLIWGVMRIVNFAHGSFIILSTFFCYYLFYLFGIDPILSIVLLGPLFFVIGYVTKLVLVKPVERKTEGSQFELTTLIVFFGLSVALEGLMYFFFTTTPKSILVEYSSITSFEIAGAYVSVSRLIVFAISIIAISSFAAFLNKTGFGKAIRATSQDREAAEILGIDTDRISLISFGLGSALAALAGIAIGLLFPFSASSALPWGIKAFIVVVLGGIGSNLGTLVGALILGLTESLTGTIFPFIGKDIGTFVIFILIVLLRPKGLFGKT